MEVRLSPPGFAAWVLREIEVASGVPLQKSSRKKTPRKVFAEAESLLQDEKFWSALSGHYLFIRGRWRRAEVVRRYLRRVTRLKMLR